MLFRCNSGTLKNFPKITLRLATIHKISLKILFLKPEHLRMKLKFLYIGCCLLVISAFASKSFSQQFTLEIQIKNQPVNHVVIGKISGDDFKPADTILVYPVKTASAAKIKKAGFKFPPNYSPGMYRLVFGQTTYAKVMNAAPQQLDFIFNNENLIFETDFEAPQDSLLVILSEENRVWNEFQHKEKVYRKELLELEQEINYYKNKEQQNEAARKTVEFNLLQKEREAFISQMAEKYPNLLATEMIKMYREPFTDGNLTQQERKAVFHKEFFTPLDFTNETLINSSVYTDRIFYYLTSYNQPGMTKQQLENEYIKAVDVVLANTNRNQKVYEFILGYLVHGFEVLKMDKVLNYIAENYSGTTCQTDEKTTLERKLEAQKMKVGTVVPDFTLNDMNGDPVTLSQVLKEKTLVLFWANWCPHCNEMIPFIKNWAKQHNDLEVVAVSLDTSAEDWKNGVLKFGTESWFNLSDLKKWDGQVAADYNIFATPTLYLIDNERKIIAKPVTVQDLTKLNL